jgi:uncharacterized surface protein with fasciclin (FAS1) repeats
MKYGKGLLTLAAFILIAAVAVSGNTADHGKKKDIVDTAVTAGELGALAAALSEAGLVDALKGSGPFTVFAPTDEAFAKLPKAIVESLLEKQNLDKLAGILK